jgi:hypothetical protein
MDSQEKQFLNADEVESNPEILRHADARQKRRNRDGQSAGISKEHIPGPFNWKLVEMQKSPAYRVLSLSARKILDRLEIELAQHRGKSEENGNLPCTYDHFVEYGVQRDAIAPAIRELVALGFIQVTRQGGAGNAEYRQPTLFLLTYRPFGSHKYVGNGWRRIGDIEEAEAIATAARSRTADARARAFGRKGGLASQAKNKIPVRENRLTSVGKTDCGQSGNPTEKRTESSQTFSRENRPPLESPGGGAARHYPLDQTTVPAGHFAWTLPLADLFPPQSLMLSLRAPTAAEILKGILH